ncbi:hypothetical protein GCM10010353_48290 [Streptomyces chryseus]|nr:hypothetical protein GCM10010353_48290 [Streptomyces chryseus]
MATQTAPSPQANRRAAAVDLREPGVARASEAGICSVVIKAHFSHPLCYFFAFACAS